MLKAAAEQFLDKSISQIQNIALETLVCFICLFFLVNEVHFEQFLKSVLNFQEGHQRAIMGTMTVEVCIDLNCLMCIHHITTNKIFNFKNEFL